MSNDRQESCGRNAIIQHSAGDSITDGSSPAIVDVVRPPTRQADSDEQLLALWIHGRSPHTQRAYRADACRFLTHVGKRLHAVTLGDLQQFADALAGYALEPASRNRALAAVKSLFAFGHRLGYLPFDVARTLRLTPARDRLAERILPEPDLLRIIALEAHPRNRVLLTLLYASGIRVSEAKGLRWTDLQARGEGGQITVFGKRGKTRSIVLPASVWSAICSLRAGQHDDRPVFVSRKRQPLSASQILRIVKRAAARAGLGTACVAHTLRHCHASHSLERGAPIHLVQATLGHSSVATTGRYLHAHPQESSASYLPV